MPGPDAVPRPLISAWKVEPGSISTVPATVSVAGELPGASVPRTLTGPRSTPSPRKLTLLPRGHLKTTILKALVCHNIIQSGEPLEDGTFNNVYFPRGIIGTRRPTGTDIRILLASKTAALSQSTLAEIVMTIADTTGIATMGRKLCPSRCTTLR